MKPTTAARDMTAQDLASYIDHSILKPQFTPEEVEHEVKVAVEYGCKTVCINPSYIPIAKPLVEGTSTGICVVTDFPFGASTTASKVAQAEAALAAGIDELDIVSQYGWIRGGRLTDVEEDLRAVVETCHARDVVVKAILETDALTWDQIKAGAQAAISAGADFIKTSTGFYTGETLHEKTGAFDEMIDWMTTCAAGRCKVKGSGAIRDRDHFLRLIDAGIDRMGVGYKSTPVVLAGAPEGAGATH